MLHGFQGDILYSIFLFSPRYGFRRAKVTPSFNLFYSHGQQTERQSPEIISEPRVHTILNKQPQISQISPSLKIPPTYTRCNTTYVKASNARTQLFSVVVVTLLSPSSSSTYQPLRRHATHRVDDLKNSNDRGLTEL